MSVLDRFTIEVVLNHKIVLFDVSKNETLATTLKEQANTLFSAQTIKNKEQCNVCRHHSFPILLNGNPINASYILAKDTNHAEIETLDYLYSDPTMAHIVKAFKACKANQHHYCVSGMELALYAYLKGNPSPTHESIRRMLSGNLCECVNRRQIEDAINNVFEIIVAISK